MMNSHELARQLLAGPDLPVVSGLDRTGYGEPVDAVIKQQPADTATRATATLNTKKK